ncbi:MAG: hypothetical protein EOP11_11400 [Proteobacteria bacterium]|nr:MAG: hypothetical protein EOP11_11400 [Pseudomonadota bacterium]
MKYLYLLALSLGTAAPAVAADTINIEDLTIVAEKGVSAEAMKKALLVASANLTYPSQITQGNSPNLYTNANGPITLTAGSIPNGITAGSFPAQYTRGYMGFTQEGEGGEDFPMPNTNL